MYSVHLNGHSFTRARALALSVKRVICVRRTMQRWRDKHINCVHKIESKWKWWTCFLFFLCVSNNTDDRSNIYKMNASPAKWIVRIRLVKSCDCNFNENAFGAIDLSDGANNCTNVQCTSTKPVSNRRTNDKTNLNEWPIEILIAHEIVICV